MNASDRPTLLSIEELSVLVSSPVRTHLAGAYRGLYPAANDPAQKPQHEQHLEKVLAAMKVSPRTSTFRVNTIRATRTEVVDKLVLAMNEWAEREGLCTPNPLPISVAAHAVLEDIVSVDIAQSPTTLSSCRIPPLQVELDTDSSFGDEARRARRHRLGWPTTCKVIVCDRLCGEAVLRGSHVFVRGILAADPSIRVGQALAVYADLPQPQRPSWPRGLAVESYTGTCVFVGIGQACCTNAQFFRQSQGLGVRMRSLPRVGPLLPPLSGVLDTHAFLQNLPSTVVVHALNPQPGDTILDLCAAPGGKASHVASFTKNQAVILAADRSRSKVVAMKQRFLALGCTSIVPLHLNATACCMDEPGRPRCSVAEIRAAAKVSERDGLLNVKYFFPGSFDRILLDPPCSALGLRPKLQIGPTRVDDLLAFATYQRKFVPPAVALLKPGGILTYSTCTFHVEENERMVRHILDDYPVMELVPITIGVGLPGLPGHGLTTDECQRVRRFDPTDSADTMGFFIAKFRKRATTAYCNSTAGSLL